MSIQTAEVVALMKKELGTYFSTEAFPDPYVYINSALNHIYNYKDWQFLREVHTFSYSSIGTEVDIPFNLKTYTVLLNDGEVDVLNTEEWFRGDEGALVSGDKFTARVTGEFSILYTPSFTKVNEGTLLIDLPGNFIDIIIALGVHYALKSIRDYDAAAQPLGYAKGLLDSIAERNTNTRPRVKTKVGNRHNIF